MRRLLAGIVIVTTAVLAAALGPVTLRSTTASAAVDADGRDASIVADPPVAFAVLRSDWYLIDVQRRSRFAGGTSTLYLASGSTPEHGPALAITSAAPATASDVCGTPTGSVVTGGAFAGAPVLRTGALTRVRRPSPSPEQEFWSFSVTGRDLSDADVSRLAATIRAPRDQPLRLPTPAGFRRVAAAPITGQTTGNGSSLISLGNGRDPARSASVTAYTARGDARLLERFWRATVLSQPCDPTRTVAKVYGPTTAIVTSSRSGDAPELADMLRRSDRAGVSEMIQWAHHPGISQVARRCKAVGAVTISNRFEHRVWSVGLPVDPNGETCLAEGRDSTSTGTSAGTERGPISIEVAQSSRCGVWIIGGRAPALTNELRIRSGARPAVVARTVRIRVRADGPDISLFGAAVPTPKHVTYPPFTITARDGNHRVLARYHHPAGTANRRCRRGTSGF